MMMNTDESVRGGRRSCWWCYCLCYRLVGAVGVLLLLLYLKLLLLLLVFYCPPPLPPHPEPPPPPAPLAYLPCGPLPPPPCHTYRAVLCPHDLHDRGWSPDPNLPQPPQQKVPHTLLLATCRGCGVWGAGQVRRRSRGWGWRSQASGRGLVGQS